MGLQWENRTCPGLDQPGWTSLSGPIYKTHLELFIHLRKIVSKCRRLKPYRRRRSAAGDIDPASSCSQGKTRDRITEQISSGCGAMLRNPNLSGIKALLPSVRALLPDQNPIFLQRCSVSRTAKGKGKLKDGQQLKRSTIPKKNAKPAAESTGRSRGENERIDKMVEACMSAPTPVRYLTPKEKRREAEREKLGLISKDRQREIDAAKATAKSARAEEVPLMGTPGLDLITLGVVDKDAIPKYELTVEDGRRLAKEHSRVLMRRTRARQAAESTLLRLKKEAIEALPEHLKAAALVPDLTPFPMNRYMASLTPPIEGYIEKIREATRKSIGKEKLR
ncbi:hypothetical protein H6P81_017550 [Aristolochia fimbriata]|uniref:Uncharacterized protein n=1 Tax=Aristolochia fimbriata TaxID=158543 RepID=A0AAV7DZV4_ARIFI|nr:hypothetical protein H6P81_017550 [Aristolochia fimbriata]